MNIQIQFILQNAHFALNLFAAFVFFAIFWLYFDAWSVHKKQKDVFKFIGFLLVSLSFIASSMQVEQTILVQPLFTTDLFSLLQLSLRIAGYVLLIIGVLTDPLSARPKYDVEKVKGHPVAFGMGSLTLGTLGSFLLSPLAAIVAFLFLRRSTIGLENHLKPVALSFFILSLSELLSLGSFFRSTTNVTLYNFVASFGTLWIIEHTILLISVLILCRWVFTYLLKRLQTQLFMIFTSTTMIIFLVTTVTFTSLLLNNLQTDALSHLNTDVNVLQYAIDSKKAQTLSDAQVIAQSPALQNALVAQDRKTLKDLASSTLLTKKQGVLLILSSKGQILARGEDPERIGESLSNDPLVLRALRGESVSSVVTRSGVLSPEVSIRSAAPVGSGSGILGVVVAGISVDNAFVDGVKEATKLDASVYGGNTRSATTYLGSDGKSRFTGIKEENAKIKKIVLTDGKTYTGSASILNVPYFSAYAPLIDVDNNPVGMVSVARTQVSVLQAAGRSIELTFVIAVVLLILSIVPAFLIARSLSNQLK